MKRVALICALLATSTATMAVEQLPTYNDSYYKKGQFVDKYLDKLVAVKGVVEKVEKGPDNRAVFQITLDGLNKRTLWVGSIMPTNDKNLIKGNTIRLLGYFDEPKKEPTYMAKISKDREYLLAFCVHDDTAGLPIYAAQWQKQCQNWETGVSQLTIEH